MFNGAKAAENEVHIGTDGWLFLSGGSNEALRLLTDDTLFVAQDARAWALKLSGRKEKLSALGAQYFHMWVPDKIKVYREYLNLDPKILKVDPTGMVNEFARQTNIEDVIVDPLPLLIDRKNEMLLYWKTDTHWTYLGACTAYLALCKAIGAAPFANIWDRPIHQIQLTLDLGSKMTPPIQEAWGGAQILRDAKIIYKNELVQFLELLNPTLAAPMLRGTSVGFQNASPTCDKRRVLIFGDSFCEYRPHLLTGLIAETFKEVLFVWSTSLDFNLIEKYKPDIVISEMAERFIKTLPEKNLPEDGFDLDNFVFDRIVGFLNTKCGANNNTFTWSSRVPLDGRT